MPKRNYGFEKRQKELARKKHKEERAQRKLDRANDPAPGAPGDEPATDDATPE